MFKNAQNAYYNTMARVAVAGSLALGSVAAMAQEGGGTALADILDAVDLSGIGTKIGAAALVIVGIALLFKGPALAKRIISKV